MNCTYYQCSNEACKFRFPFYEQSSMDLVCPFCKSSVNIVSSIEVHADPIFHDKESDYIPLEALLDNIRSAWNVGSMFRTADGFGIRHLHLCGMTPTPHNKNVAKTSLGAEKFINWTYEKNSVSRVYQLKELNYTIVSIEEHKDAQPIYSFNRLNFLYPLVLVVGNEICGVDPEILEVSDHILKIPMLGIKKSLNVAVAFGIAVSAIRYGVFNPAGSQDPR